MKESENKSSKDLLLAEIKATEQKLQDLKKKASQLEEDENIYSVPDSLEGVFSDIEKKFSAKFRDLSFNPEKGQISISDERYLLMRSSSMSYDFFQGLISILKESDSDSAFEIAGDILYEIAYLIGMSDAKHHHENLNLKDPLQKLSAGPINFAFTGWASVEILPESNPVPTEDYYIKYHHRDSFEAEAWMNSGEIPKEAVCTMSAGYSAGWCSESYGLKLEAQEISCKAKGDESCVFIMAPTNRINEYLPHALQRKSYFPKLFAKNTLRRKVAEKERIIQQAERFSKLGTWTFYFEDKNLIWSSEVYDIFEISKEDKGDLYSKYLSRLEAKSIEKLQLEIERLKKEGGSYEVRHFIRCPSGKLKYLVGFGEALKDSQGSVIGLKGIVQDITNHLIGDRELDHFFKLSVDLQCIANTHGYFVKISPSWSNLLGYSEEELLSRPYVDFVHPDDKEDTLEEAVSITDDNLKLSFENRYITKSGEIVILSWNSTFDTVTELFYCTAHDVTKQKKDKERLLSNLTEKEILLREIHHRVKNNLQVISSLLSLQSGMRSDQPELIKLYADSQNRIKSMAAIHEMFYKSENLDQIDFRRYMYKLISDLVHSFRGNTNSISLDITSEELFVDLDTAIPLGLIINEIITNALKHGIQPGTKGTIHVDFKRKNKNQLQLIIGDDGVGKDSNSTSQDEETLGMMLISSLVEQLDGEIKSVQKGRGTYYQIIFDQEEK